MLQLRPYLLVSAISLLGLRTIAAQEPSVEGQKIFRARCFVCHGLNGDGRGPSATSLGADPRNFTDPAWQKQASDERILQVIRSGGVAIGESAAMPPNPDLSDAQVRALLQYIRGLAR
jgi:mono/diheme cytochrome c family protein